MVVFGGCGLVGFCAYPVGLVCAEPRSWVASGLVVVVFPVGLLVAWILGVGCGDLWTARSCGLFRLVVVSECWFWWGVSGDLVGSAM